MHISSFDESNAVLDKPPGMTYDECEVASICRTQNADGRPVVITCWRPTREELDEIIATGRVWLTVMGYSMPPVHVSGHYPFVERDPT